MKACVIYLSIFACTIRAAESMDKANSSGASCKNSTFIPQTAQRENKNEALLVRFCVEIAPELVQATKNLGENELQLHADVLQFYRQGKMVFKTCIINIGSEEKSLHPMMRSSVIIAMQCVFMCLSNGGNIHIPREIAEGALDVEREFKITVEQEIIKDIDFYLACAKAVKSIKNLIRENFKKQTTAYLKSMGQSQANSIKVDDFTTFEYECIINRRKLSESKLKQVIVEEPKASNSAQAKMVCKIQNCSQHICLHDQKKKIQPVICAEPKLMQKLVDQQSAMQLDGNERIDFCENTANIEDERMDANPITDTKDAANSKTKGRRSGRCVDRSCCYFCSPCSDLGYMGCDKCCKTVCDALYLSACLDACCYTVCKALFSGYGACCGGCCSTGCLGCDCKRDCD